MTKKLPVESINNNLENQYVSFWIENKRFGINIASVKEIYAEVSITPIYHSTDDVRGYINIRGEIFLVADIRKLLGLQNTFINIEEKLIILKDTIVESFGILIDKIDDVVNIHSNNIEKFSTYKEDNADNNTIKDDYTIIDGICKLENGLIIILNSYNIMQSILNRSKANLI